MLSYENPPPFVEEYLKHVRIVLGNRAEDVKENVRLESLKQIMRAFHESGSWDYLKMYCDKINDSEVKIRKLVISGLMEVEDDILEMDKEMVSYVVERLIERTIDEYHSIREIATKALRRIFTHKKGVKILD